MDANAYATEIERRFPDQAKLQDIRKQIEADKGLDENARWQLSARVGSLLLSQSPDPPGA